MASSTSNSKILPTDEINQTPPKSEMPTQRHDAPNSSSLLPSASRIPLSVPRRRSVAAARPSEVYPCTWQERRVRTVIDDKHGWFNFQLAAFHHGMTMVLVCAVMQQHKPRCYSRCRHLPRMSCAEMTQHAACEAQCHHLLLAAPLSAGPARSPPRKMRAMEDLT